MRYNKESHKHVAEQKFVSWAGCWFPECIHTVKVHPSVHLGFVQFSVCILCTSLKSMLTELGLDFSFLRLTLVYCISLLQAPY